jgi:hypothetical protein
MIGAPDALARVTSLSVMPPTPAWSTRALISSVEILLTAETIASTEPCTSPLITSGNSTACFSFSAENMFSRLPAPRWCACGRAPWR